MKNLVVISTSAALLLATHAIAEPGKSARTAAVRKCSGTTNEFEVCIAGLVEKARAQLENLMKIARERIGDDAKAAASFDAAGTAYTAYEKAMCGAVYDYWRTGTIRGAKSQCCSLRLISDRSVSIWEEYVTYQDSTPPPLPRPAGDLCDE